jgi:hypothetical protein
MEVRNKVRKEINNMLGILTKEQQLQQLINNLCFDNLWIKGGQVICKKDDGQYLMRGDLLILSELDVSCKEIEIGGYIYRENYFDFLGLPINFELVCYALRKSGKTVKAGFYNSVLIVSDFDHNVYFTWLPLKKFSEQEEETKEEIYKLFKIIE